MRERAHGWRGLNAGAGVSDADRCFGDDSASHRHVAHDGSGIGVLRALETHQRSAYVHDIVRLTEELLDAPGLRRWDLDDRLVGFHRDERLVDTDFVALLDMPLDDLRLLHAFTEIGQLEDFGHAYSSAFLAASMIRSTLGIYWLSSRGSGTTTS